MDPMEENDDSTLTVDHHVRFRIVDEPGLIAAGRAAYLTVRPHGTPAEARAEVSSPSDAVAELIHAHGWHTLEDGTEHLSPLSYEISIEQGGPADDDDRQG
ncbi:hypothetical protein KIH74_21890 [Kineosporia sp. J2-2]|uniref:Uncharacterized protein n=1 Tax=Kineosporia corallincola TaxID=2835133 RepID=A0ABS5TKK0_9ACTN|nr:hypothetical protein [Kineosporia corallincola]MBT0771606.1 hypothetical protein [Kineosporia corallincola]